MIYFLNNESFVAATPPLFFALLIDYFSSHVIIECFEFVIKLHRFHKFRTCRFCFPFPSTQPQWISKMNKNRFCNIDNQFNWKVNDFFLEQSNVKKNIANHETVSPTNAFASFLQSLHKGNMKTIKPQDTSNFKK